MNLSNFSIHQIDEYTPKSRLAKVLSISSRTIYDYHQLALDIDDFLADYPSFDDEPCTRASLTKYQCWVLVSLMFFSRRAPRSHMTRCVAGVQMLRYEVSKFLTKTEYHKHMKQTESSLL
jgi:hypothetical protein